MADFAKKIRDILGKHGCTYLRHGKGDHDIWYSPLTNRHITVYRVVCRVLPAFGALPALAF
jgi:hypothetical protein